MLHDFTFSFIIVLGGITMNTLIISDIHGSHQRLQEVLATPLPYDQIILVGDSLYHGPRNPILNDYNPQAVADLLNAVTVPILAVRGNCDAEVDQMLLNFPMMQDYTLTQLNNKKIYITHGHLVDPNTFGPQSNADIFVSGHTHIPVLEISGNTLMFNPGSIALPKGGHPNSYGYLSDSSISILTLDHKPYMTLDF